MHGHGRCVTHTMGRLRLGIGKLKGPGIHGKGDQFTTWIPPNVNTTFTITSDITSGNAGVICAGNLNSTNALRITLLSLHHICIIGAWDSWDRHSLIRAHYRTALRTTFSQKRWNVWHKSFRRNSLYILMHSSCF